VVVVVVLRARRGHVPSAVRVVVVDRGRSSVMLVVVVRRGRGGATSLTATWHLDAV
jgi:hypothetical protein